jgi:hypothetical protein
MACQRRSRAAASERVAQVAVVRRESGVRHSRHAASGRAAHQRRVALEAHADRHGGEDAHCGVGGARGVSSMRSRF